jgi:hypothetical protein
MEFLKLLLQFTAGTSALLMLLGLYKPWTVLWWEDVQNRRKVLLLYGSITGALWAVQLFM